jgi:hypothetical protein
MRPPTRSTRSVRTLSNPPTNVRRRSRGASLGPPHPLAISEASDDPPRPRSKPQSPIITTAAAAAAAPATTGGGGAEVDSGTYPGSEPALASAPIVGCFPALPPATTFVFENQNPHHHHDHPPESPLVGPNVCTTAFGKPPRSRHRLSSDKLGALDAFFRRNTHPTRKEKEAICKDLDM